MPSPGLSPEFVFCTSPVRILSIFESGTEFGFYQASVGPGPGPDFIHFDSDPYPDFIKHVQVRVRVLDKILPISYVS